jgi:hypothetical protein
MGMNSTFMYSEQSRLEMEKYIIDLAIKLIEKGIWVGTKDGCKTRLTLSIENIHKLQDELKQTVALYIFAC